MTIARPCSLLFGAGLAAMALLTGCASAPKQDPVVFTTEALIATDPVKVAFPAGSTAADDAIRRFEVFNGDILAGNITNNTKSVYAPDVWFRDPFKFMHGEPEFEAYLLRGSGATAQFSIDWKDVAENDGNYYFRWVMSLKLNRDAKGAPPSLTTGISHVRFDHEGRVIFQQDYYDGGAFLYEKIPILGSEIRFIKSRM